MRNVTPCKQNNNGLIINKTWLENLYDTHEATNMFELQAKCTCEALKF